MMGKSKGAGVENDGLEITAIGSVYKGPWEKKYWSCSRGRYRHPYPIGYQAIRNHSGQMYKMEIQEGDKGPVFVVISEEGIPCVGDTPTIAWEKVQTRKTLRFQKRHRSQFSRVDGAELFGFTNPLVQRLFRELLANGNETSKQSDTDIHQHEETPGSGFGQLPLVTTEGSMREKCLKLVKGKSVGTSCLESPKSNKDSGSPAASIQNGGVIDQSHQYFEVTGKIRLCVAETKDILEDTKPLNLSQMLKDTKVNFNGIMNNKEDTAYGPMLSDLPGYLREMGSSHYEHEDTLETCIKNLEVNGVNQKFGVDLGKGTLEGFELETGCTNPFTVKDELLADSMTAASVQVAKDVLEEIKDNGMLKDSKSNKITCLTIVTPPEANSETPPIEPVISKECNFSLSQKVTQYSATQSSDGNIDKGDSDSMGQELAKSMMIVLLPQALPLIKQADKKRKKIKLSEGGDVSSLAKHDRLESVDELHTERKDAQNLSSEMHVVSNLQICEDTHIDSGLSFGIAVTNCGLGMESQTLCIKASNEEFSYCDTSIPGAGEKTMLSDAVSSYADSEFENIVCVSKMDHTGGGPSLTNFCHDKEMPFIQAINVLQVSKAGCTNLVEAGIEQKLHKSKLCESTDKDCAVIEDVVPDSFEDEEYLRDNLNRNSYVGELQTSFKSHNLPAVNTEADPEALGKPSVILEEVSDVQKFGCSTDNMDVNLRRKNSLCCSRESDVKEDIIMPKSVDYKAIRGICINDGYTNSLSTQVTAFNEFNPDKSVKRESIAVLDHSTVALILDQRHGEGDHFVNQIDQMAKYECNEHDLRILDYKENIHDEKSHCVDCECKAGQFCGLQEQDSMPLWESGICNPEKNSHDAYSAKRQQARDSSHDLQVISAQVNISVPCCRTTNNGLVQGRAFDHSSFDKKSTAEENLHIKSSGQFTDKECSYKVLTSWADCIYVSQSLFKEKPDFRLPEETPGISIGTSHCKQTQISDTFSDTHVIFPPVSNLEMYAHMTMDVANHQGVDCFGHVITGKTNSICYKDFKSASCCQSIWVDSLSTELKGFCSVSTFSDMPPSIVEPQTVLNSNYSEDVCHSQDIQMNAQQQAYENKQDISSTELVGCYEHSIPVISMLLSVHGVDIRLCVVCGVAQERQRSIFIYKVVVGDASGNCSWLIGYAVAMLPDVEYYLDTKSTVDRYGIQLTPGGENLILLESIEVQNMREPKINCLRSQCLSQGQCKGHGVKLVSVKDAHVSVLTVLSSTESMYCVLVSASQSIIAAGENGIIHVWNMDTSWRDISRCVMLSNFWSVDYNIFQSIALGCVTQNSHDNMSWSFTDCELLDKAKNHKDLKDNMMSREEAESRMGGNKFPFSHAYFCEENTAVCLLVLAAPNKDEIQTNQDQYYYGLKQRGLWRFALLENNVLLVGSILDERASAVSMLSQSGVIGTSEGYIYIWDAMTGRKIFTSRDFEGVHISCISQNQMPGAFAVAGSNNRVLLYAQVLGSSNSYILGNK
ncbi:uncharacterized protein LOC131067547 isoform X2 [Cryptomeria japonica]|uniref:uncharacterized protein LOC131067547 isoform X2 n=1 Tax=Cryptomeria japonica TaxID=3369 RepID=UPI0027D9E2A3|nr:uncharacterized protein LOC131067547 isoform X2 [Cryptomeria japonica]